MQPVATKIDRCLLLQLQTTKGVVIYEASSGDTLSSGMHAKRALETIKEPRGTQKRPIKRDLLTHAHLSLETHMHPKNTKFVIQSMLHESDCPELLRCQAEALAR